MLNVEIAFCIVTKKFSNLIKIKGGECPLINSNSCCKDNNGNFTGQVCIGMDSDSNTCVNWNGTNVCATGFIPDKTGLYASCKPTSEKFQTGVYATEEECIKNLCSEPSGGCCSDGFTYDVDKNACLAKKYNSDQEIQNDTNTGDPNVKVKCNVSNLCGPAYSSNGCNMASFGPFSGNRCILCTCVIGGLSNPPLSDSTIPHYSCNPENNQWIKFNNDSTAHFDMHSTGYCS